MYRPLEAVPHEGSLNALSTTSSSQNTGHHDCACAKARAHLFGTEYARGKKHPDSDEHHGIGSYLRHQHHSDNCHHGDDGNPSVYSETPQYEYVTEQSQYPIRLEI